MPRPRMPRPRLSRASRANRTSPPPPPDRADLAVPATAARRPRRSRDQVVHFSRAEAGHFSRASKAARQTVPRAGSGVTPPMHGGQFANGQQGLALRNGLLGRLRIARCYSRQTRSESKPISGAKKQRRLCLRAAALRARPGVRDGSRVARALAPLEWSRRRYRPAKRGSSPAGARERPGWCPGLPPTRPLLPRPTCWHRGCSRRASRSS
jgi:hypothetical protein